ncbi:STE3-domain-containing protein [Peniophora sp. CONT]|nr:STE3-domain-containing protein [Peniophora sp. CONT]
MDPTYPLVPLANFAAAFLTLLTFLTAQLRESWNMGVCMLSAWVFVTTLSTGVQTVVWRDNADTSIAPAFCDIATRIQIGTLAAMPACTLVITRSLHRIVSYQTVVFNNPRERRRELILDLFLVLGLPIILNILYYVVQDARFWVIEEIGCSPALQNTGMAILLLNSSPIILSLISGAFYMSRIIFFLWRHKRNMNQLFGRQIAITRCVYLRVFCFGLINLMVCLTVAIANFFPFPQPEFYPGWSAVHANWTSVSISAADWHSKGRFVMFNNVWNVWVNVWLALAIFGLFGLTEDARKVYVRAYGTAIRWTRQLHPGHSQSEILALPPPSTDQSGQIRSAYLKRVPSTDTAFGTAASGVDGQSVEAITIEIAVTVEQKSDADHMSTSHCEDEKSGCPPGHSPV